MGASDVTSPMTEVTVSTGTSDVRPPMTEVTVAMGTSLRIDVMVATGSPLRLDVDVATGMSVLMVEVRVDEGATMTVEFDTEDGSG